MFRRTARKTSLHVQDDNGSHGSGCFWKASWIGTSTLIFGPKTTGRPTSSPAGCVFTNCKRRKKCLDGLDNMRQNTRTLLCGSILTYPPISPESAPLLKTSNSCCTRRMYDSSCFIQQDYEFVFFFFFSSSSLGQCLRASLRGVTLSSIFENFLMLCILLRQRVVLKWLFLLTKRKHLIELNGTIYLLY